MSALSHTSAREESLCWLPALLLAAAACGPTEGERKPGETLAPGTDRIETAGARAREARARGADEAALFWEGVVTQQAALARHADGASSAEVRELFERGRRRLDEAAVMIGYRSHDQEVVREALLDLEQAVAREPWIAEYQHQAGYGWFLAQDYERAQVRFETAIDLDPDHFAALQGLGTIHLNAGAPELAEGPLERVVQLRPDDANGHYVLGKCREELGRLEASEVSYRRSLTLHPGLIEPYNRLGGVLLRVGRQAEGKRMLDEFLWWKEHEKALRGRAPVGPRDAPALEALQVRLAGLSEEAPEDARLAVANARVLAALGRTAELKKELRRARRAAAGDPDVLFDAAEEWRRLGDLERASALLTNALRSDPNHVEARLALAALLERGGRVGAAREHYRAALQLAPDCVLARRALAEEEQG